MGCTGSSGGGGSGDLKVRDRTLLMCEELGMTAKDVSTLWKTFMYPQPDGSSGAGPALTLTQFMIYQRITNESFAELVFSLISEGSEKVSFANYCLTLWNLLTLDDASLPRFSFRIFDADSSGKITVDELHTMVEVVTGGDEKSRGIAHQVVEEWYKRHPDAEASPLQAREEMEIGMDDFLSMTHKSPLMLFPAFELIRKLREQIVGKGRWATLIRVRRQRFKNMDFEDIVAGLEHRPLDDDALRRFSTVAKVKEHKRRHSHAAVQAAVINLNKFVTGDRKEKKIHLAKEPAATGSVRKNVLVAGKSPVSSKRHAPARTPDSSIRRGVREVTVEPLMAPLAVEETKAPVGASVDQHQQQHDDARKERRAKRGTRDSAPPGDSPREALSVRAGQSPADERRAKRGTRDRAPGQSPTSSSGGTPRVDGWAQGSGWDSAARQPDRGLAAAQTMLESCESVKEPDAVPHTLVAQAVELARQRRRTYDVDEQPSAAPDHNRGKQTGQNATNFVNDEKGRGGVHSHHRRHHHNHPPR